MRTPQKGYRCYGNASIRSAVAISLALITVFFSGCAGPNRTIAEGAAIGTLTGATVGAVTGRSDNIIIGAIGGLIAGTAVGYGVSRAQTGYQNQKMAIDAAIRDVDQCNRSLEAYNRQLRAEVQALQVAIRDANLERGQRRADRYDLVDRKNRLQLAVRNDYRTISAMRERLSIYERDYQNNFRSRGYQNIGLENEMSRLRMGIDDYNRLLSAVQAL